MRFCFQPIHTNLNMAFLDSKNIIQLNSNIQIIKLPKIAQYKTNKISQ